MARPSVPKFGNWDNDDNVPYTVYFDKARKGRGGKMINPNDPQENPDMFPDMASPAPAPAPAPRSRVRNEPEELIGRRAVRPTHDRRVSKEDSDLKLTESPGHIDNVGRRAGAGSAHQRGGAAAGRSARPSAGSDYSFEKSPLHPNYQAKLTGRGSASPAWEGKSSYESSHGTPGRSRMRPTRGEESPDRGAQVPRFGEWDENNPQSADNYTHIFNKVREEKATGSPMVSGTDAKPSYNTVRNQKSNENKGWWWLPCISGK